MCNRITDYGDVVTVWDHELPETEWACPICHSRRVHLTDGRGIICYRTRNCGFAPFEGGPDRAPEAIYHGTGVKSK